MKRRNFLAASTALVALSCARDEKRAPRYDPKECPFCTIKRGVCSYCKGSKRCPFCNGKGKRKATAPKMPGLAADRNVSYEEECPYCKGGRSCTYCGGSGICWACGGSGRIESWDFQSKYERMQKGK
jgi:RecJ-like exonuclease